jgi:hypothetical protein
VQALARAAALTSIAICALAVSVPSALASSGTGTCYGYVNGSAVTVQCSYGSSSGGTGPGPGGGHIQEGCAIGPPLTRAQAQQIGLQWPPPKGYGWALLECLGGKTVDNEPQVVLIDVATGSPPVTPQQLLAYALSQLQIPALPAATAPPRGRDGLVGLPEWFWIPAADWQARTVTVRAGPVWATATAAPAGLALDPGAGLEQVSCAGPGTAYDPAKPASGQHTNCSYTYAEPSAGQPQDAYQATLTVTWRVSWTGSGGAGGVLDPALAVPYRFAVRVAQGEALVSTP